MNRQLAFTLVELLITLAVLTVLISVGLPAFTGTIQNSQRTAQTNEMIATLYNARTEAIKRNGRVTVCKTTDAMAAEPACNTNAAPAWDAGWIVFVDDDGSGTREVGEEVLQVHGPTEGSLDLSPRACDADIQLYISYTARGVTRTAAGNPQTGRLHVLDGRGINHARDIVLSPTGRAQATADILECP